MICIEDILKELIKHNVPLNKIEEVNRNLI